MVARWIPLLLLLPPCSCTLLKPIDPVAVGHVQSPVAADGRKLELRTLSLHPPVFLVRGLLSDPEADELIDLAQTEAWRDSTVSSGSRSEQRRLRRGGRAALLRFDVDRDGRLGAEEMQRLAGDVFNMPNYDHAAFVAYVGARGNAVPLAAAARADVARYFERLLRAEPQRLSRFSRQTWMEPPHALRRRASALLALPTELLQVVRYVPGGHYACHHDSDPDSIDAGEVRLGTLALYLNNVSRGGETVFPGAGKKRRWGPDEWSELEERCQRTEACTQLGGLTVQPRKGDGIFWYNVRPMAFARLAAGGAVDGERALDWSSLHCGAEVLEGEKWLANLWFRAPGGRGEL